MFVTRLTSHDERSSLNVAYVEQCPVTHALPVVGTIVGTSVGTGEGRGVSVGTGEGAAVGTGEGADVG